MLRFARRLLSNTPESTVYGGPKPQTDPQRTTLNKLRQKHRRGEPITVVTAYDYPSAVHIDLAGIDVCLVGDSASMVVHGHDTTLPISLDEMLVHCRAVARGASRPLLIGDLPFGSYESSSSQAVDTAVRVLKEGGMDAIKLEGGAPSRISAARAIVEAGIAVMGHVGLTPQAISVLGGFRPQGKTVCSAVKVVETALALQEAGCFSVVLECVPAPVAAATTSALQIPTIGIGAGPYCNGQFSGKRVGILGLGRIGLAIAKRAEAFNCSISYYSRTEKPNTNFKYYPNLIDLATNSDVLVVACALTEETHHIINREVIDALGPKGVLVNIGRGPHVDEPELVKALVEGRLGGAGLDVFENEPEVPEELFGLDNVVLLPHVGSGTVETRKEMADLVLGNLEAHVLKKPLLTPVV